MIHGIQNKQTRDTEGAGRSCRHAPSGASGPSGASSRSGASGRSGCATNFEPDAAGSAAQRARLLLVLDIDDPVSGGPHLFETEADALRLLCKENGCVEQHPSLRLAVASAYGPDEVARAFSRADLPTPRVIQLDAYAEPNVSAQTDAATKLAQTALVCGARLSTTIVIAGTPLDLPLLTEAAQGYALGGAGRACFAAADKTFPARRDNGLAHALAHLMHQLASDPADADQNGRVIPFHPIGAGCRP